MSVNSLNPGSIGYTGLNSGGISFGGLVYGGSNAGQVTITNSLSLATGNTSNFVTTKAPTTGASYTITAASNAPPYVNNVLVSDSNGNQSWANTEFNSVLYQASNGAPFVQINNAQEVSGNAVTGSNGTYTVYFTKDGTSNTSNLFSTISAVNATALRTVSQSNAAQFPLIETYLGPNFATFTSFNPGGNTGLGSAVLGSGTGLITSNQAFNWLVHGF